jgi:flagellar biosynthetic protein FliP
MVIAMFAGMAVLGLLLDAAGLGFAHDRQPELAYLLMAFDMSVGMAVWMRYRGHGWAGTLEMCAAMFVPVVPLFPLLWLGVIDAGGLMLAAHVAMFPLMLAAMFRRLDEYAGCGG